MVDKKVGSKIKFYIYASSSGSKKRSDGLSWAAQDKRSISASYNNIGNVYSKQGNYPEALKKYFASLKIKEEIKDKPGIARTLGNIGDVYYVEGNYPEALKNISASLKIMEEIGYKQGIAQCFYHIGIVHIKLQKLRIAEDYLNKGLKLSKEINSKDDIKASYRDLALLDSIKGNWKEAYQHHKLFIIYRDSIDNEETKKKTIESSMTYKFETQEAATKSKQDKKDAVAAEEKQKEKVIKYSISVGLFLVLLLAIFIFRGYRLKQKANIIITQQKAEVEKQKVLVEEKNKIVEEKHKEITDSINYAERIQHSFLASKELLTENLNEHFVLFQPKDVVSGDFYWASKLSNGNFALVTADSTGHGVPGAIMSI